MSRPTLRAQLADAERIMRELLKGEMYVYDDVRDWLTTRALMAGSRKGRK
jgi:hypothetical protein